MEKQGRSRSLAIPAAIAKLRDTAEVITRRGGLKKSELKRIPEAVAALTSLSTNDVYDNFLRKVSDIAGLQIVVLCAVGLGRTVIKGMKDRVRVDLPFEVKNEATSLENAFLQNIVDQFMLSDPASDAGSHEGQPNTSNAENVTTHLSRSEETLQPEGRTQELSVHLGMLTGYVCGLNVADAQAITTSDHVNGAIWLTYPYDSGSAPFVTIPITPECARLYVETRPQMV